MKKYLLHNTKQIHLITLVRNLHNFLCNTTVGMGGSKSKYQRMVDEDVDAEALVKSSCRIITGLGDFNTPRQVGALEWHQTLALLRRKDLPTLVTAVIGEAAKVR